MRRWQQRFFNAVATASFFVRIEYGLFLPFLRVSFEEFFQLVKLALQGDANALGCKR